jgi:opacity protein-like surface antigen
MFNTPITLNEGEFTQEEVCMKKVLLGLALTVLAASSAFAGQAKDNTGCGLGSLLWENKADNSVLFQAFQATTNGTSGAQTFGITSGTSNCSKPSSFVQNDKLINFVQANMDSLAQDIAMGKGESLDTFAEMLGVAPGQTAAFNAKLQANFSKIFTSENVVLAEVIDNAVAVASN